MRHLRGGDLGGGGRVGLCCLPPELLVGGGLQLLPCKCWLLPCGGHDHARGHGGDGFAGAGDDAAVLSVHCNVWGKQHRVSVGSHC